MLPLKFTSFTWLNNIILKHVVVAEVGYVVESAVFEGFGEEFVLFLFLFLFPFLGVQDVVYGDFPQRQVTLFLLVLATDDNACELSA